MLSEGRGVLKDEKEAVKWYAKSAEQGYVIAQNNLGSCYRLGLGVESNANEAVRWYRKAAEAEDAWGQYNLGMSYHTGTGFEKNETEARQWFAKAAKQGHQAAKDELMAMQKNP